MSNNKQANTKITNLWNLLKLNYSPLTILSIVNK